MRRRGKAGGKPGTTRRRKTSTRRNTPKTARHRSSGANAKETNVVRLTHERDEARGQQKAPAEILQVIRASPSDAQPVFETIVRNAVSLCGSLYANVFRFDGELLHFVASHNVGPSFLDMLQRKFPMRPDSSQVVGRVMLTKSVVRIEDTLADPEYDQQFPRSLGFRRLLGVPMLREGEPLGAIVVGWAKPGPVLKIQEELLKTFSDQAAIAIENTRLLSELRQRTDDLSNSLQQQTATADVLKAISRSTFDLQTVLDTLVNSAARLCRAEKANITLLRDGTFHYLANVGFSPALIEHMQSLKLRVQRGSITGRAVSEGKTVHVPDILSDPEFAYPEAQKLGNFRTALAVPLMREGAAIGAMFLSRERVEPFGKNQIELVETFADQAVIAIANVRLFDEVQTRTRELAKSLNDLRTTQDRLVQTQKLASLGQLTAGIAHEIKNPLNFVNNFSGVSAELVDELKDALKDSKPNEKRSSEIAELMDTLRSNLDKVVQHGRRADAIVKNMLLHSHQGSGEHRPVAINALVEESLKLAYHGARAEKNNFNVMVEQSFDPVAGEADVFPQEITRVLLNLISNGVYATRNKTVPGGENYRPRLTASTKDLGDRVEIRIRDNGTGIQPDVKEKMFNPFFTTKPAGEGTGLGLSISHDIIVKQHGGSMEVDTQPGEFTEVRIVLPRTAVSIAK
jgi:signal transduction histidine kinase